MKKKRMVGSFYLMVIQPTVGILLINLVQLVESVVEKFSPSLYNSVGIFLPLIAVKWVMMVHRRSR